MSKLLEVPKNQKVVYQNGNFMYPTLNSGNHRFKCNQNNFHLFKSNQHKIVQKIAIRRFRKNVKQLQRFSEKSRHLHHI